MDQVLRWLETLWQGIVHHFTHMTLWSALGMGLALLTVLLLILMSTRWGQVKPVWKCVILSVLAHILLGGYAYGTRLIFTSPAPPPADTVSLKLVDSETPDSETKDETTTRARPWDQFDLAAESKPRPELADRLKPAVQKTIQRTQPEFAPQRKQPQIPAEVGGELATTVGEAVPPPAKVLSPAHQLQGTVARAEAIEIRRQRREEPSLFNAPDSADAGSVTRMDPLQDKSMQREEARTAPRPVADGPPRVDGLLQQLAQASRPSSPGELGDALTRGTEGLKASGQPDAWGQPEEQHNPYQLASAPRRLADGAPMPDIYAGRSDEQRKEKAARHGGSLETERAVSDALNWLAAAQEEGGSWSGRKYGAGQERLVLGHDRKGAGSNADTGITGLALLAFLAAGNSHLEGPHRRTVQRGLEYLLRQQATDGNLAGEARLFARMYCHAMATLAITETLAMTGDRRLQPAVQRAVDYSLQSQNARRGGWRYRPGDDGDMSQFGWQVLALKSAELGGIEIPEQSQLLMKQFLDQCTGGAAGGLAGYRPGARPTATMTAEALLCRYFLYENVSPATQSEASQFLLQQLPGQSEENLYYWYYGTLAMFHAGGPAWSNWNHHLTRTLVRSQVRDGADAGSWAPGGVWAGYGGRVYSTAMATLCLEVYYRYDRSRQ